MLDLRSRSLFSSLSFSAILLLGVVLPGLAQAQSGGDIYSRPGFYVGLRGFGASYTVAEDTLEDAIMGASIDIDDVGGVAGKLGYRASQNIAVEFQFDWLSTSEISTSGLPAFVTPEIDSISATINAKFYLATDALQPYALLGVGVMHTELSVFTADEVFTGAAGRFGAGAEYYITENLAIDVGVDYLLPSGDVEDLDYVSYGAGIVWRR